MTLTEKLDLIMHVTKASGVALVRRRRDTPLADGESPFDFAVEARGSCWSVYKSGPTLDAALDLALEEARRVVLQSIERNEKHMWETAQDQQRCRTILNQFPSREK